MIRFVIVTIVSLFSYGAEIGYAETQEWKTSLKTIYHYSPEPLASEKPSHEHTEGEILYLEPMVVKLTAFRQDIEEATRRAEAAEKAARFSPITGGLIFSKKLQSADLKFGLWPKLVPVSSQAGIKKEVVGISVDVLEFDW